MKKIGTMLLAAIFVVSAFAFVYAQEDVKAEDTIAVAETQTGERLKSFGVFSDKHAAGNHYIPSGWMGDYGDIKLNDQYTDNPHGGTNCLQFVYSAKKAQGQGWAGVYWQNPANNWGTKKGGFDLTGMTKITFWARGEKGTEVIQKFVVGGVKGTYPDSAIIEMGPVELTDTWKEYTINLASFFGLGG